MVTIDLLGGQPEKNHGSRWNLPVRMRKLTSGRQACSHNRVIIGGGQGDASGQSPGLWPHKFRNRAILSGSASESSCSRPEADDRSLSPWPCPMPNSGSDIMRRILQGGLKSGRIHGFLEPIVRRLGKRRVTLLCRVGLILYLGALGLATHMPPRQLKRFPLRIDIPDKLAHFAAYALLAVLAVIAAYSFGVARRLRPSGWAIVGIGGLLLLAGLGLFDEATQPAFGRQFDWLDWAADLAGAATAATLAAVLMSMRRRSMAQA